MIRGLLILCFLALEGIALIGWLAYHKPLAAAVVAVFGLIPLWAAGRPMDGE